MQEKNTKLKFFEHGSQKIDFSKLENLLDLDASKPIEVSKDYNKALKNVIEKDIMFLSRKVREITKEIKKILLSNNINMDLDDDIENIENLISKMDIIISDVVVSKGSYKVGLFSTKKKEKKQKTTELDKYLDKLTKYQTEIIAIKNEYDKLKNKREVLKEFQTEENKEDKEDPLERTINFYLNKQKNSNEEK